MSKISDRLGLMKVFLRNFETIAKETKDHTDVEAYDTWAIHLDYARLLLSTLLVPGKSQFTNEDSLLSYRASELLNHLTWTWVSIRAGAYHQAIRELRFAFESTLMSYYIDREHPDASKTTKLEIIKVLENSRSRLYGRRLINKLNLPGDKSLKDLYSELSNYVHCSYDELKPFIDEEPLKLSRFAFNSELFNKCRVLTNKTLDAVYSILLNGLPDAKNKLKMRNEFIDYFKTFEFNLALIQLQ